MEISRNRQNFIAMTVIYNELNDTVYGDNEVERKAKDLIEELCECDFEEVDDFLKNLVFISLAKYTEISNVFIPELNNWKWDRIPTITRAILVMSYTHFYYVEKVDKDIVINIAIELAKKYIDDKQAKFINAILDKVLK